MTTFGFIGTGNMGGALAKAVAKTVDPKNITLCDANPEKAAALAYQLGCAVATIENVAENVENSTVESASSDATDAE